MRERRYSSGQRAARRGKGSLSTPSHNHLSSAGALCRMSQIGEVRGSEALDPLAGVLDDVYVPHAVDSRAPRLQELPWLVAG
jgi:hypothetical protein